MIGRTVQHVHQHVDVGVSGDLTAIDGAVDHRAMLITRPSDDCLSPGDREFRIRLSLRDECDERSSS